MALQSVANKLGFQVSPLLADTIQGTGVANLIIDAAGESLAIIGRVMLEGGTGSKTISSAGGAIYFTTNSVTWANAATNLRVGIQDVAATGLEDTTYDVYADLVPGTETLTSNAVQTATMESGSKTIAHGDLVAIVIEMTARGGADSVDVQANATADSLNLPYKTADTGSGPAKAVADIPGIAIKFDDSTYGWLQGVYTGRTTTQSFNSSSTPDEYALIFQLPFPSILSGVFLIGASGGSTRDFEVILYSDPLGTPSAVETVTVDADVLGTTSTGRIYVPFTDRDLDANTDYAIAMRPTTTSSGTLGIINLAVADLRKATPLGTNWSLGSRTNQSGAFSQTTTQLPMISLFLSAFDDGASAGGLKTHPGMHGGMRG